MKLQVPGRHARTRLPAPVLKGSPSDVTGDLPPEGPLTEEPLAEEPLTEEPLAEREPLPAGHPDSWGAITAGTLLDGTPYPLPFFTR